MSTITTSAPVSKTTRISYWAVTGLVAAMNTMSGIMMMTSEEAAKNLAHLSFPSYFGVQLGAFKLAGVLALLLPVPKTIKEWAYAGFGITFISAAIAHTAAGDGPAGYMGPLVALVLLVISRFLYGKVSA